MSDFDAALRIVGPERLQRALEDWTFHRWPQGGRIQTPHYLRAGWREPRIYRIEVRADGGRSYVVSGEGDTWEDALIDVFAGIVTRDEEGS